MAKPTRQARIRAAMRISQDNDREMERGVRESRAIWRGVDDKLISAALSGRSVRAPITKALNAQEPVLVSAMQFFYLKGFAQARKNAVNHVKSSDKLKLNYDPQIATLLKELPLSVAELAEIKKKISKEAKRVLKMTGTQLEQRINNVVKSTVKSGLNKREAVKEIRQSIKAANLGEQVHQIETVFRTTANMSYNAGRWEANQDPAIQSILWGFEYVTVGDGRVRDEHALLDGARYPKDSPRWNEIWPSNGWNCRCSTIEIYADEEDAKTKKEKPGVKIDKGFAVNFGTILAA